MTTRKQSWTAKIVSLLMWVGLGTGTVFGVLSLGLVSYRWMFVHHSLVADAVVTGMREQEDKPQDGGLSVGVLYCPQVRFRDEYGVMRDVDSGTWSRPAEFVVGQAVRVRYWTGQPEDAVIESFGALWMMAVLFGGFAAVLLAVGLACLAVVRRNGWSMSLFDFWEVKWKGQR